MPQNNTYLIIAQSGRALAASAFNAGMQTHVFDRFADSDTKNYALSTHIVDGTESGICSHHVRELLDKFKAYQIQGVIVGSGFESQPDILDEINDHFTLYGNSTSCIKTCKEPVLFFPLLESLDIPYPSVCMTKLGDCEGWLIKRIGGTGGRHIYRADNGKLPDNHYYQKYIKGRSISVTFLANGQDAILVGINETWTVDVENDFTFAGASTLTRINSALKDSFVNIIKLLTAQLHLVGLCGVDVIVDEDNLCYLLEVNPRPVSTFELYEHGQSLFHAHVEACKGKIQNIQTEGENESRGFEIQYIPRNFIVPDISWPAWITDRPAKGLQIASGEPVCTIHAAANSSQKTRELLKQRKVILNKILGLEKIAA